MHEGPHSLTSSHDAVGSQFFQGWCSVEMKMIAAFKFSHPVLTPTFLHWLTTWLQQHMHLNLPIFMHQCKGPRLRHFNSSWIQGCYYFFHVTRFPRANTLGNYENELTFSLFNRCPLMMHSVDRMHLGSVRLRPACNIRGHGCNSSKIPTDPYPRFYSPIFSCFLSS